MSTRHLAALLPCGLLPLLAACIDGGTETATVPAPASSKLAAQIRYTTLGVPHVLADSFKNAGYGYGYAYRPYYYAPYYYASPYYYAPYNYYGAPYPYYGGYAYGYGPRFGISLHLGW